MKHKLHKIKPLLFMTAVAVITVGLLQATDTSAQPNPNIFGMEGGNYWVSDDGTTETVEELDPASYYPREYWVKIYENGDWVGSEMFGIAGEELKLWSIGSDDLPVGIALDSGLTVAWYPLSVGEEKTTTANDLYTPGLTMTINAKVIAYEQVTLSFDTVYAYKIRHTMTVSGPAGTSTETLYGWAVPYLGFVKSEDVEGSDKVVSFAIGGGTITQDTDTDGDGLKDYKELIYNTNLQDPDTDQDGLTDGEEVNTYGTDPNSGDTDSDGLSDSEELTRNTNPLDPDTDRDELTDGDEVNIHGTDPNNDDTDSDALKDGEEVAIGTNPTNSDTDTDNMSDGWEVTYGLNPLVNDAGVDSDGDGLSNLEEYESIPRRNPTNCEPHKPALVFPSDGDSNVLLTPTLETGPFEDFKPCLYPENDLGETEWQISSSADFSGSALVFHVKSDVFLASLTVPDLILTADTTYYWRARFHDDGGATSDWSDEATLPFSFTTVLPAETDDPNENGVPDDQEEDLDPNLDLDGDTNPDVTQGDMKCAITVVGGVQIGVKGTTPSVVSVDAVKSVNPDTVSDTQNKPDEMPLGLVSFKATVANAGDSAEITIYLSEPAPSGAKWYKYDPINGWREYPYATFSADRTNVTLQLEDGSLEYGDTDGAANRIIVDPGGVGVSTANSGGGGGGGGGCFIDTAANGFSMAK